MTFNYSAKTALFVSFVLLSFQRVGHDCPVVEVPPSFTVLSPADFLHLLNL